MLETLAKLFILIELGNEAFAASNDSPSSTQTVDPVLYVLIGILGFLFNRLELFFSVEHRLLICFLSRSLKLSYG
jgi:hypothetical protein